MIAAALAVLAALLHIGTSGRYGYFRDELYFIACSKHLAWGYVDQPPLVAVAAWLAGPAGYQPVALRVTAALSAALTVFLTALLVRELGGGRFAQFLAALATLLAPAYLLLGNLLTTTSFEPLSWTLAIYATVRIVRAAPERTGRWWLLLAAAITFGLYGKYSIVLLAGGLAIGLLLTPQRRALRTASLYWATALTLVLFAPNLLWQASHGWPIVEVLFGDAAHRPALRSGIALESAGVLQNAGAFALEQLLYTNPLAAPVWLAGIVAPFRLAALRDLRFLAIAYLVAFGVAVALAAKGYYIVGMYAALFAVGAVAFERAARALRFAATAALALLGVAALPLAVPLLSVDGLLAYTKALGVTGRNGTPAHLMQPVFAEEFGWDRLARDVARAYDALPARVRTDTAVYADTYADAGAIDFFGPRYGLPPAISSQNSYFLWGTHGYDGRVLIAIGATRIDLLRKYYRHVTLVGLSSEPYRWIVEGPSPIYLCRDPVAPLPVIWPNLRWYGA